MAILEQKDVQQQSMAAWNVWRVKWLDNCAKNKMLPKRSLKEMIDHAKGEILVHAAFGYSLALHLDTLKAYRDRIKIFSCDKAFGYLKENGITPDYCIIADASVSPEWIKDQDTSETILFSNVAANPEWTYAWRGPLYLYVNYDNIGSADILGPAADCNEVIPASSNVSNAQVVLASQILNPAAHLLLGYDYSWEDDGLYYAGGDSVKRHYMHMMDAISPFGKLVKTSTNLDFSCKWLMQYLMKFQKLTVVNCSERGLLDLPKKMPLEQAIHHFARRV